MIVQFCFKMTKEDVNEDEEKRREIKDIVKQYCEEKKVTHFSKIKMYFRYIRVWGTCVVLQKGFKSILGEEKCLYG